ncbi:MAG TPA: DHHA1 domain-containing protein [Vicinamibacterales bacterium]
MTERLYYTDPYLREFDAVVVERTSHDGRPALVLDRTAFYPSSGGQPYDTGLLAESRVLDVIDREDGGIVHVMDRDLSSSSVHGTIDWERRFDHMQQHTGQHVLSAAFDRAAGARTESVHLGVEYSTIDLGREVSSAEIDRAEDQANRVVWEDRPVTIRFASAEEVAALPLRKESKREGTLRLIDVEGFDLSACGGTHVSRTGAIGTIVVSATERFRGGTRVTFLCGGRTLAGYRLLRDAVAASVRTLAVLPAELPAALERIQTDAKELRRQVKDYQTKVAAQEADALAQAATPVGSLKLVVSAMSGWDAAGLKLIAARIAERSGLLAILVSEPPPAAVVVARAADLSIDSSAILKAIVARHGGKGGGRPEMAQGGGLTGSAAEIIASARELASAQVGQSA